jgi:hypothetical protein
MSRQQKYSSESAKLFSEYRYSVAAFVFSIDEFFTLYLGRLLSEISLFMP